MMMLKLYVFATGLRVEENDPSGSNKLQPENQEVEMRTISELSKWTKGLLCM